MIAKRKNALLAALEVFKEVREKGLNDNPEDRVRIIEAGNHSLERVIKTVPKIAPKDEGETVRVFVSKCEEARLEL